MQTDMPDDSEFYDEESMDGSQSQKHEPIPHSASQSPQPMAIVSPSPMEEAESDQRGKEGSESDNDLLEYMMQEDAIEAGGNDPGNIQDDVNVPVSQNSIGGSRGSPSPIPVRDSNIWNQSILQVRNSLTDAVRYPLCMDRYFHPNGLMQPKDHDLTSLDANGKAWVMERPPLSRPIDGNTWSFVDECHAGITNELLKVIYFFDIMNGMSNHFNWNGFVVGTGDISGGSGPVYLKPSYAPNNKDINGVTLSQFVESDDTISLRGVNTGLDTGRLLYASELNSSGMVNTSLQLFRISVGFTAAVFESNRVKRHPRRPSRDQDDSDNEEEQQQAIFGVVTVTALRNADTLRLIMVSPPVF
jgi:hypothetical protein